MLAQPLVWSISRVTSGHTFCTPAASAAMPTIAVFKVWALESAGAGGAAHLPGVTAAKTVLPVLGVPVESKSLKGLDSLLSMVQMPAGIPVATFAIGPAGATNAALFAAALLATSDPSVRQRLGAFRDEQTRKVLEAKLPEA